VKVGIADSYYYDIGEYLILIVKIIGCIFNEYDTH